jgi:hypothetical protein
MAFIKLTRILYGDGERDVDTPVHVNVEHIVQFGVSTIDRSRVLVKLADHSMMIVRETPEEIISALRLMEREHKDLAAL